MVSNCSVFSRLGEKRRIKVVGFSVGIQTEERVDGRLIMQLHKGERGSIQKEVKKERFNSKCLQTRRCSVADNIYDEAMGKTLMD